MHLGSQGSRPVNNNNSLLQPGLDQYGPVSWKPYKSYDKFDPE